MKKIIKCLKKGEGGQKKIKATILQRARKVQGCG